MTARHTLKVPHAKDLDQMSSDELRTDLASLRQRQMTIKASNAGHASQPLAHPSGEARSNRRTIARIMTILVRRREPCVV